MEGELIPRDLICDDPLSGSLRVCTHGVPVNAKLSHLIATRSVCAVCAERIEASVHRKDADNLEWKKETVR